jgi:hypothetical protein
MVFGFSTFMIYALVREEAIEKWLGAIDAVFLILIY